MVSFKCDTRYDADDVEAHTERKLSGALVADCRFIVTTGSARDCLVKSLNNDAVDAVY
jgi:hypothetical protein